MTELAQMLGEVLQSVKSVEKDVARLSSEIDGKRMSDAQVARDMGSIRESQIRLEAVHASHLVSDNQLHTAMEARIRVLEDRTSSIPTEKDHIAHKADVREEINSLDEAVDSIKKDINSLKESKAWVLGAAAGISLAASLLVKFLVH